MATFELSDSRADSDSATEISTRLDRPEHLLNGNLTDEPSEFAPDPSLEDIFGAAAAQPSTPLQNRPMREAVLPQLQPSEQCLQTDRLFVWKYRSIVFVLPYDAIEEHVIPQPHQTLRHPHQKRLSWREQMIPIYPLSDLLDTVQLPSEPALNPMNASVQSTLTLVVHLNQTIFAIESPINCLVTKPELRIQRFTDADSGRVSIAHPRYIYRCLSFEQDDSILLIDIAALLTQKFSNSPGFGIPFRENAISAPVHNLASSGQGAKRPFISRKTILVIDDSRMVREILKKTLKNSDYKVLEAKNGKEGIDVAIQNPKIDLVICDVAMPIMNGFDFLKQCRQYPALETVPVVMLSNCTSDVHQNLARRLGAADYFTKPYLDKQLLSALQGLLNINGF
jgi:two-component system, chemotaxis family, sensor histidine kinase and response regulator PixL